MVLNDVANVLNQRNDYTLGKISAGRAALPQHSYRRGVLQDYIMREGSQRALDKVSTE